MQYANEHKIFHLNKIAKLFANSMENRQNQFFQLKLNKQDEKIFR